MEEDFNIEIPEELGKVNPKRFKQINIYKYKGWDKYNPMSQIFDEDE